MNVLFMRSRREVLGICISSKDTTQLSSSNVTTTGACSMGTKMFCESIKLKDEYKLSDILELTKGKYGDEQFAGFLRSNYATIKY